MAEEERPNYYDCFFCGERGFKELWGPGRMICPHCGRKPLTAEQYHERNNEVWNGKEWVFDPLNTD